VSSGTVTNNEGATISDNGHWGIWVKNEDGLGGVVTNSGTIEGNRFNDVEFRGTGDDTFVNTETGVVGGNVVMGNGEDTAQIHVESTINGTINGGNDVDVLIFETNDPDQIDDLAAALAGLSPAGGTLDFNGQSFRWSNFEELRAILTIIIEEVAQAAEANDNGQGGEQASPTTNEIQCGSTTIFQTPDGFVQVYSGFGDAFPNGFLVSVFKPSDVQVGDTYNLEDPNTPAWSVNILAGNMLNVLNDTGDVVGACPY